MAKAFLSLGCNMGDCAENLTVAVARLGAENGIAVARKSSVYRTEPVGSVRQPYYLNIAVELNTDLSAEQLLSACRAIEEAMGGREGRVHMGPRAIDLDILLYGQVQISTEELIIPHPRMLGRAFVLVPLAEIAPDEKIPGNGTVKEALAELDDHHRVDKSGRLKELEINEQG